MGLVMSGHQSFQKK